MIWVLLFVFNVLLNWFWILIWRSFKSLLFKFCEMFKLVWDFVLALIMIVFVMFWVLILLVFVFFLVRVVCFWVFCLERFTLYFIFFDFWRVIWIFLICFLILVGKMIFFNWIEFNFIGVLGSLEIFLLILLLIRVVILLRLMGKFLVG